jgi:hypothetical protein
MFCHEKPLFLFISIVSTSKHGLWCVMLICTWSGDDCLLSDCLLRRVVWYKLINVSEVLNAFIITSP